MFIPEDIKVNIRIREDGGDLLKTLMNLQFP
jgi:hypothetical protein